MTDPARLLLLGPVDLRVGETSLALGAPRHRALLALLALASGRVKPVAAIIDELWGDDPPSTVVNVVQVYVASLRKVLAPAGLTASLVTQAPGYRLMLPPGTLDVELFDRDRAAAARRESRGDHDGAATAYRAALDQWRGTALADLDFAPYVAVERRQLEEARLATLVGWLRCLAALGAHDEALPPVEKELAANPFHEELWGLRATLLYQAGRQSDALTTLRRARRLLATELGVEPGPGLLEVERRVLAQDPELGGRMRRPPSGSAVTHVATGASAAAAVVLPDGRRLVLGRRGAVVGRHPDCEIVLDHRDVSRTHARIAATSRGHSIEDLGSTNGTAVNGEPVLPGPEGRHLSHADRIEIGPLIVRYEAGSDVTS
ncbi:DNA-binding transcriptional activator of the SARP family [Pedococcus dokdonensis]|uniref:DNA-binding transcriptional activator of the SARP family n=1 Tax=Pedococcus dokdonensis TaxID=443156 RepID=A0A1H0SBF9_9MICO|nr:BTAD domain-containing putative transcriptional regulator [Pedococcus dokdonensis]SDP38568.1 DNA-binding transcriptional activator of the SARP family [Pedococcus dokdonensis]